MRYLIQSVEKSKMKDGRGYLRMTLFEKGGKSWPAIFWEERDLEPGTVIEAITEEGEYKGSAQLIIKGLRVVAKKPDDAYEFLPNSNKDVELMYADLVRFANNVTNPDIKTLLQYAVTDPRWKRAPAAKALHHAFIGGLLEHVTGLCKLSHVVSVLYPQINSDYLVAASILHDIGKMEELECGLNIDYTDAGNLIGHISIGFQRVTRMMDQFHTPSVNEHGVASGVRLQIEHIILSHHGKRDWGSPVVPMTIEANIFHKLDEIDAKMSSMTVLIANSAGKTWTEWNKAIETKLYVGDAPTQVLGALAAPQND